MERAGDYYSSFTELKAVNRVRMSFHMVSISDKSTADNIGLDTRFLNTRVNVSNRNTYVWLRKHRVTTTYYCV